ncbi:MAG TPA: hypothetical protein VHU41_20665, partial [Thermoanaerobaculia bacterium]|nr:hypothetical protein [Thermoanaerobaculia bacterium]
IVWTGDHYLASWYDFDASSFVAAPLSRDGVISGGVRTVSTFSYSAGTALAWNGRHAFAVFNTPGNLWGAILDADGNVVRKVTLPTYNAANWAVAAAGQTFAVVWVESIQSTSTVKFQRYGDDGSLLDPEPVKLAENLPVEITQAGIAGNATQFGVAYAPFVDSSIDRLRIDASTGAIERLPVVPFVPRLAGVYWSGDDFVAYGRNINAIATERFSSDALHVLTVSPTLVVSDPRLASSPFGTVAIWTDMHLGQQSMHAFGSILDTDATAIVKGNLSISLSSLPQAMPVLAPSNSGALLAWIQEHDQYYADIVVRRLNAAGAPIDAAPVTLATNVPAFEPSAVWLGNAWLVVWTQFDIGVRIVGKRVSASGEVLDANPIALGHGQQPLLVTNGATTILVFRAGNEVEFVRLNANGEPIDSEPITTPSSSVMSVAAATNGSEFVISWAQSTGRAPDGGDLIHVFAARLTASGQPIDTVPITIANSTRSAEWNPAIASDGRDFLIVYSDPRIVTKRLLAEGSLAGSTAQDEGRVVDAAGGSSPVVAWNGSGYVVAWKILHDGGETVVGTTVDQSGVPTDTPRALGRTDSPFDINAAAANVQGTVIVAYPHGNAEDGVPQIFTRQILNGSPRERGVRH